MIHEIAQYEVHNDAIESVRAAIIAFVEYVKSNEPGTITYDAWQDAEQPNKFCHIFRFTDEAARREHGASAAVRHFEDVYGPVLIGGAVRFTKYESVASNRP